jgi:nicotinamide-nucleotide amidase
MLAHIITIGNELLIGQVIDTNSAYMASQLTAINFKVDQIISVSDTESAITHAIETSLSTADLVVISGGLGPTRDDITKTTLCKLFKTNLVFSEEVFSNVTLFLEKRKVQLNELNRQQAMVPACAHVLPNQFGTAPGLWFEQEDKVVVCLPGVPFEMKGIFEQELIPRLKIHFKLPALLFKTYLLTGIAESVLAERIADWEDQLPQNTTLAYLPSPG